MSTTRRADPATDLIDRQERFCSSPGYERGLLANLVARRAELLAKPSDVELVWYLQWLSLQRGGLTQLMQELLEQHSDRIGTRTMRHIGKKSGQSYSPKEVSKIRSDMPHEVLADYLLDGELSDMDILLDRPPRESDSRPKTLTVDALRKSLKERAEACLRDDLIKLCLEDNPELKAPWYFADLLDILAEKMKAQKTSTMQGVYTTEIGRQVYETFEYSLDQKVLVSIEGSARVGKTYAARAWAFARPGLVRFIETPSTPDDAAFLRQIALSLGLSNMGMKTTQLRNRIEATVQTAQLMLIFDESAYLWPTGLDRHRTLPRRISWIMTALVNRGVPVAFIGTPQFTQGQKFAEKHGWNSGQLIGRILEYKRLPDTLSEADLRGVARAQLSEATEVGIRLLAAYAKHTKRFLAGIDAVVKHARYAAKKEGRVNVVTSDLQKAVKESVLPSDTALRKALGLPRLSSAAARKPLCNAPESELQRPWSASEERLPSQVEDPAGEPVLATV